MNHTIILQTSFCSYCRVQIDSSWDSHKVNEITFAIDRKNRKACASKLQTWFFLGENVLFTSNAQFPWLPDSLCVWVWKDVHWTLLRMKLHPLWDARFSFLSSLLRKCSKMSRSGTVSAFDSGAGQGHDECKQRKASESLKPLVNAWTHDTWTNLIMNNEVSRPCLGA